MRKAIFLYNKKAGNGKIACKADKIVAILCAAGYECHGEEMDYSVDPFAGGEEYDLVVIAGGDGTVNHTVNCMKEQGVKAALGVIPSGTTNDFAESLGMSMNPLKAAAQIASGAIDHVDCGYVNGLFFVNIFSFGLLATTSRRMRGRFKWLARLSYIMAVMDEIASLKSMKLKIEADGGRYFNVEALMVLILNGSKAGGLRLAKRGAMKDGQLDCLVLRSRGHIRAVLATLIYLLGGESSSIKAFRARNIQILSDGYEPTDADGERGVDFPLNVECLSGELKVVIPSSNK